MKKILALIGMMGAGATANSVYAQSPAATGTPTCALDDADHLEIAPNGEELFDQQTSLTKQKENLANKLKALSASDTAGRKKLGTKVELNQIALSYVQKALAFYASRQSNIKECESAQKRWTLVNQIDAPEGSAADKQVALDAEEAFASEKLVAAKTANGKLVKAAPSMTAYANLSLTGADIVSESDQIPNRQASAGETGSTTAPVDSCARMISYPAVNLRIGTCGSAAKTRSARSFSGGDVAFPSSVLKPRGLAANLAGSSSDGTVSITYADSFKRRRTPSDIPGNDGERVQLPWEIGYSFGVKAKDGVIFSRDDIEDSIKDKIDGQTTVSAGLFFNVYDGETLKEWKARAAELTNAAVAACRKEQAAGESKAPSTCSELSLTNWVYALKKDGSLLHPTLAKQADDLYFRSKDDKPVWGGGINASASRRNYNFLEPDIFTDGRATKNETDGGWNYELTAFAYRRLNPTSSKWDVSLIGSVSRNSVFGYPEGTKTSQFCPTATTGTPFVTSGCPSYYTAAPKRIVSWTPAAEVRILTKPFGPLPRLGISPKLSYESIDGSAADRWRIAVPVLAFVEKEAGLGVGLEYSREWGGFKDTVNDDGFFEELKKEDKLKIIVTKTFSLTGR